MLHALYNRCWKDYPHQSHIEVRLFNSSHGEDYIYYINLAAY